MRPRLRARLRWAWQEKKLLRMPPPEHTRISITLPDWMLEELREIARNSDVTISEVLRRGVALLREVEQNHPQATTIRRARRLIVPDDEFEAW